MTQDASPPQRHPIDIHVGRRLRLLRRASGFNQQAVADAVGVTFQQVQKYERGSNRISASRLYQFATVLKAPVGAFFEGLADPVDFWINDRLTDEQMQIVRIFMATAEGAALARGFLGIASLKLRRRIVSLARELHDADDLAPPNGGEIGP